VNLNKNNRIVLWISLFMTLAPAGSVILAQTQNSNPVADGRPKRWKSYSLDYGTI